METVGDNGTGKAASTMSSLSVQRLGTCAQGIHLLLQWGVHPWLVHTDYEGNH